MKRVASGRPLTEGINVLARAADKASARSTASGRSLRLSEPSKALARNEVLIAVADATRVALKLVKIPATVRTGNTDLHEVARRIAEIDLVAAEIAPAAGSATAAFPPVTEQEERLLRNGKLNVSPLRTEETHLLYRASAEYARLLHDSYTVEQVAHFLGVNTSRIRQRLIGTPRTLYGIKFGRAWRIPKFQFRGRRLVPGIETVLQRIPANLHAVAVYRWFVSPNPDLTSRDEKPISPLDWLRIGNTPDTAADLAADL